MDRLIVLFGKFDDTLSHIQAFIWRLLELHILKMVAFCVVWVALGEVSELVCVCVSVCVSLCVSVCCVCLYVCVCVCVCGVCVHRLILCINNGPFVCKQAGV